MVWCCCWMMCTHWQAPSNAVIICSCQASQHSLQPALQGPPLTHVNVLLQAQRPGGGLVAIKALTLRSMQDWRQLELFEREARALQGLRHEGIPRFVEYFEVDTDADRGFFLVQVRGLGCLPFHLIT